MKYIVTGIFLLLETFALSQPQHLGIMDCEVKYLIPADANFFPQWHDEGRAIGPAPKVGDYLRIDFDAEMLTDIKIVNRNVVWLKAGESELHRNTQGGLSAHPGFSGIRATGSSASVLYATTRFFNHTPPYDLNFNVGWLYLGYRPAELGETHSMQLACNPVNNSGAVVEPQLTNPT